jgi:predicted RNA-binding Zn-ribbon protein involved in translation (DUF1610 family)
MADQHPGNPQPELTTGSVTKWHFAAARVEAGAPAAYRLARYRTAEGQTHLKLQGYYSWTEGAAFGGDWRDIETVDLDPPLADTPPPLVSLEDHNRRHQAFPTSTRRNGIACPQCGEELVDSKPGTALLTNPLQYLIHCPTCTFKGTRL